MNINPVKILQRIFPKVQALPPEALKPAHELTRDDIKLFNSIGLPYAEIAKALNDSLSVSSERTALYREMERAGEHTLVVAALNLYADFATQYNRTHNASVWVTSEDRAYTKVLTKLFDDIGIEESIYDWGFSVGEYGDLFIDIDGEPGTGIISIEDGMHPSHYSRLDYKNTLCGFYKTPFEAGAQSEGSVELIPPWSVVHIRLLGNKKRRPNQPGQDYQENRTTVLMGAETKQLSSKYGTPIAINALPIYKRLRLAEDSLLMARLTRGISRNIFKVKVSGDNMEASAEIIQHYVDLVKRSKSLNTTPGQESFDSKFSVLATNEDLFLPVFGDVGDLTIEELGGKVDIKWIVDIEDLRNQLCAALHVPLALLGGSWVKDASGALGADSLGKLDIGFARSSRRLQRALIQAITRICQIHLAYRGMDPDPKLFTVQMSESSTAEEEELRDSLDKGTDVIDKFMDMLDKTGATYDKVEIMTYLNQKLLKLNDFDLKKYKTGNAIPEQMKEAIEDFEKWRKDNYIRRPLSATDCYAALPMSDTHTHKIFEKKEVWESKYKKMQVTVRTEKKK